MRRGFAMESVDIVAAESLSSIYELPTGRMITCPVGLLDC